MIVPLMLVLLGWLVKAISHGHPDYNNAAKQKLAGSVDSESLIRIMKRSHTLIPVRKHVRSTSLPPSSQHRQGLACGRASWAGATAICAIS